MSDGGNAVSASMLGAHQLTPRTASSMRPRSSPRSCGVKLARLRCTSRRTAAQAAPSGTLRIEPSRPLKSGEPFRGPDAGYAQ